MCIAIVTFDEWGKGGSPGHDDLAAMEDCNPHGAGVAWSDPAAGALVYVKGLDAADVEFLLRNVPRPALVHFRWATHGGKAPHLTHPFPLGPAALVSESTHGTADRLLIHNGTWSKWDDNVPAWLDNVRDRPYKQMPPPGVSDTAVAAYVAAGDEDTLKAVPWCTAVMRYRPDADGDTVTVYGKWEREHGTYFSNLNWRNRAKNSRK